MQIQLESSEKNTIRSYTETSVTVNATCYDTSLVISPHAIISPWPVKNLSELTRLHIEPLLQLNPEVILIGCQQIINHLPSQIIAELSTYRIGIECMSVGAACRTFNVLLNEHRRVLAGMILAS